MPCLSTTPFVHRLPHWGYVHTPGTGGTGSGVRYTKCITVRLEDVGHQTWEPRAAQNIACAGSLQAESRSGGAGNMKHRKQEYGIPRNISCVGIQQQGRECGASRAGTTHS
ncbi:hypothetical protein EDD15DRAFT_2193001 [Pisolithus albus]|nr:hypothetical protein EDD15DRAFT_2193001 [Pisolithus albus]